MRRRAAEVGFWVVLIALLWTLDTLTKLDERARTGVGLDDFRLYAEQATSGASALAMVAFVAWWLRRFPLSPGRLPAKAVGHLAGSALFAAGHYGLMVALRAVVYPLWGRSFRLWGGHHLENLVLEYQKDVKIYIGMAVAVAAYRHYRRGRELRAAPPPEPRLAVQTAKGERLLPLGEIDYLEAARNYVAVHSGAAEHLVRDTLQNLIDRLPPERFARAHRSFVVNVERVAELRATGTGGHAIVLRDGREVPLGRRYRERFQARLDALRA